MEISPETAAFLLDLLNRQTVQVGAPDFDTTIALVQKARQELSQDADRTNGK